MSWMCVAVGKVMLLQSAPHRSLWKSCVRMGDVLWKNFVVNVVGNNNIHDIMFS